ncbi:MAG: dTDP-4-dehydrorhamnose reductase [Lentisphaeria bacterium]|nr:dTDP-4-dehydrorhamnose reductase [Lentisphaeria bacterium]
MKVLITGGKGMLGRTLQKCWQDWELVIADLPEADICDPAGFDRIIAESKPDAVVHCAGMTQVDRCETESELAYKLNAFGTGVVASACHRHGVRLAAISTDYVFSGDMGRPYHEWDAPAPKTVYGASKLAGEEMVRTHCPDHLVLRIAWLYGVGGPSFVHTIRKAAAEGKDLKVVRDQIGNPTSAFAVANHLRRLLEIRELTGTFHLTCEGEASWYEFACELTRLAGLSPKIEPCTGKEFPRPAPRPADSRLEKRALRCAGLPAMPDWHDVLAEFMKQEFPG